MSTEVGERCERWNSSFAVVPSPVPKQLIVCVPQRTNVGAFM